MEEEGEQPAGQRAWSPGPEISSSTTGASKRFDRAFDV